MRVIFDYQIFYLQRYGGISRYFIELAKELNKLNDVQAKIVAPYYANEYIENIKTDKSVLTFNPLIRKLFYNRYVNKQIQINESVTKYLCSRKTTLLHETYYTNRIKVNCPKVITIHDMIYELFNNDLEDEKTIIAQKKQAIYDADCIIAVSENTKNDLLHFYPHVKNKTIVVHHGVDQSPHAEVPFYKHPKPFLLHVGNRGWYKNFNLLLEVFAQQKEINQNFDLICFGGGLVTKEEEVLLTKGNIKEKVKFISGNDKMLSALYKSAQALIYISNYEGFGMPLLEAMALGCPVISSNTSSLPEVYGNAAIAIDPKNQHELVLALNTLLFNESKKIEFVAAGKINAAKFTWKKCAEETFSLYNQLM